MIRGPKWLLLPGLVLAGIFPTEAQVDKVAIKTTGISCGLCAGLSEVYFRRMQGVDQVKISLKNEAILLSYKPGAQFDPQQIRKTLQPLGVGVVQFQISAHGQVRMNGGERLFTAGKDKFVLLDAIDSPTVPLSIPVVVEGILLDKYTPMELKVLSVKTGP
ncbi:MAG: hypothetical protein C5B51_17585 [Terriglobia bacterium]|nr:MAG: hypothetical protein C5B51_17585 [Terriglobia bacterium]